MPAISADGRYVAQVTFCPVAPNDLNGNAQDVYVYDRLSGTMELASVSSTGEVGNVGSCTLYYPPTISADGRLVAFYSYSDNLVAGDTNGALDAFVHDRVTGETVRVSVDSNGSQGNGDSGMAAISGDGRYVAFTSTATNLVANDWNAAGDVFVHDLLTHETVVVSVDDSGVLGNGASFQPSISHFGRLIAFQSEATNLVLGDTNHEDDVFVHDRATGKTTRASVDSVGLQGNAASSYPCISPIQPEVVYQSYASNLVAGDTNGSRDVFVHHLLTGQTTLVSVSDSEQLGDDDSGPAGISADGRYVAFHSFATNLVGGDGNGVSDIFLRDRVLAVTRRVSVSSSGEQGNLPNYLPVISADARFVAFDSDATNLVPGDTNGWRDNFVHGAEFTLQAEPEQVAGGQQLTFDLYRGIPDNVASIWAVKVDSVPVFTKVYASSFDAGGVLTLTGVVPPGLGTFTLTLRGLAIGAKQFVVSSNDVAVEFE
ncbi:MAG: hypothetical protein U1E76_17145 [Planctomycetota bacterium]